MSKTKLKLNVDAELLEKARQAEIALDAAFEAGLKLALSQADQTPRPDPTDGDKRAEAWARESAEAIKSYNARIERRGVFGQDLRRW